MEDLPTTSSATYASDEDLCKYAHVEGVLYIEDYPSFEQVPESTVLSNWIKVERMGLTSNEFQPILDRANFVAKHGLTPVYYTDAMGMRVFVTSQEHVDHKLH